MLSDKRIAKNRMNLGLQVKEARLRAGFTQKAFAAALGIEYYTMISQMELGYISIPPSLWVPVAQCLNMDQSRWVLRCLDEYQPEVYRALFQNRSFAEVGTILDTMRKGGFEDLWTDPKQH